MSSDQVIEAIAQSITLAYETDIVASALISAQLVPEISKSSLKNKPKVIEEDQNARLYWYGGDALYTIEALWPIIQKKKNISYSFVQTYAKAWASLQKKYSTLQIQKMIPEAVMPDKAHPLDSGFDITVVRIVNPNFGPGVVLYGSGLIIRPPDGYYVDMVARSSTCKLGWGIANHIGIIDAQYRGELCVPMFKLSPDAKPIELPARVAQIVVRRLELCDIEEVESMGETQRGAGGFGSSGK